MRFVGIDVHLDFCEVAIAEGKAIRSVGRIETDPAKLELFAQSLGQDDQVVLEATGNAFAIARIIEPRVARVAVLKTQDLPEIARAKAKTDRRDAKALAKLAARGFVEGIWVPDEQTSALRRRIARRAALVRQRTRQKNAVHAVLLRSLKGRCPVSDLFGKKGRVWLEGLDLPLDERETVNAGLRTIDFLSSEIDALDRAIACQVKDDARVHRLMSVPGIDVTTAATLVSVIGEVDRFASPRKLVGYLGLDPKVRQSGVSLASIGRISKQGPSQARHVLVEAAWVTARTPGPMHAFYERVRSRRGVQVAIVAVARKLACLAWQLLRKGEDYAFARPSLVRAKRRRLELKAGAPKRKGKRTSASPSAARKGHEAELAAQAEAAYRRLVADWSAQPKKRRGRPTGARILKSSSEEETKATRQGTAPDPAL
jgi:transposase